MKKIIKKLLGLTFIAFFLTGIAVENLDARRRHRGSRSHTSIGLHFGHRPKHFRSYRPYWGLYDSGWSFHYQTPLIWEPLIVRKTSDTRDLRYDINENRDQINKLGIEITKLAEKITNEFREISNQIENLEKKITK